MDFKIGYFGSVVTALMFLSLGALVMFGTGETFSNKPDVFAAHGYDAMKILAEALRKGGTLPSDFEKGILGISSFPGVTGSLQFDEKGDVQKYPRVYRIVDGQPLNYEEYVRDMKQAFQERLREIERRRKALLRGQR